MMAAEPSIAKLIVKQLHQELTPEEQQTLDAWLDERPENRSFMAMNIQPDVLADGLHVLLGRDDAAILEKLDKLRAEERTEEPGQEERTQAGKIKIRKLVSMAAAAAVIVFAIVGYEWNKTTGAEATAAIPAKAIAAVEPASGRSRAILTLMNGQPIGLDTVRSGMVAEEGGMKIFKNKVGTIVYEAVGHNGTAAELQGTNETAGSNIVGKNIVYNTLSVPTGAVYRVTLPDGTEVQVNTGSSLRYPLGLVAGKRMADVKGEAFFRVSKDPAHPFIVQTGKTEINV